MKRVLCVVASMNAGGAETFLMKILRRIDKSEYMLDFIVSASGIYDEEIASLGGKIYTVPLRTKHPILTFCKIRNIVKANNYKFFLKLCDTPMGLFDLMAAKMGGATHISVRSCNASSNTSFYKEGLYSILRPIFNAFSDCKIAPSDLAAKYTFGEKCLKKGCVKKLNNGIDLAVYKYDAEARNKIRKEFAIGKSMVLLGHIGRFNQQKNHHFLINVFYEYHKRNPNSMLILVGTGELLEEIHNQIRELKIEKYVIFTGIRKDIPQILSALDFFLLPSFYEGLPNTVVEAQAVGVKCFISDTITTEANVTGKVSYLPINVGADIWADSLCEHTGKNYYIEREKLEDNGFGIDATIKKFIEYVFG